ncbi:MAG: NADP oxidoreductase [Desulfomonilia bacterium]
MKTITMASTWCEGCSGCHMSFLDMDERLVELIGKGLVLTATPITDLKIPPMGTDLGIIEGAVATDHHMEDVKELRHRCKMIVALGDCAVFGGINTMRNYFTVDELLHRGYVTTESTVNGTPPTSNELGKLLPKVLSVHEVVKVDFFIPGCPPPADVIYHVLNELVEGRVPRLTQDLLYYD